MPAPCLVESVAELARPLLGADIVFVSEAGPGPTMEIPLPVAASMR